MVQSHLREDPSNPDRGPIALQNLPIEELISRFKSACDMVGFMKTKKPGTVGIYNSNVNSQRPEEVRPKCDKCKASNLQCLPSQKHCTEKGHQKGQNFREYSPRTFYTKSNCPYCLYTLQKNVGNSGPEPASVLSLPPNSKGSRAKCDKCLFNNKSCSDRFNHCRKLGHQTDKSQTDLSPKAWNTTASCPFCPQTSGGKTQTTHVRSVAGIPAPMNLIPPLIPKAIKPPPFPSSEPKDGRQGAAALRPPSSFIRPHLPPPPFPPKEKKF